LDIGCGTGEMAYQMHLYGATVIGIDTDAEQIARAQSQFPDCQFMVGDARKFVLDEAVDAIFSNKTLHWIPEADEVALAIARALKPGGRLVAEFGGKGNLGKITRYLDRTIHSVNLWYFPSTEEYSTILEKHGLQVTFAQLSDRPTPLPCGHAGLHNWILMFENHFLNGLNKEEKEQLLTGAEHYLREELYNGECWVADCKSLRIVAFKDCKKVFEHE